MTMVVLVVPRSISNAVVVRKSHQSDVSIPNTWFVAVWLLIWLCGNSLLLIQYLCCSKALKLVKYFHNLWIFKKSLSFILLQKLCIFMFGLYNVLFAFLIQEKNQRQNIWSSSLVLSAGLMVPPLRQQRITSPSFTFGIIILLRPLTNLPSLSRLYHLKTVTSS